MASDVIICNAALQLIKHSKQITSLEQGIKEANACEVIFVELRDTLLASHNWNFAEVRAELTSDPDNVPAFEWDYFYEFPGDFLRLHQAFDNDAGRGTFQHRIEGHGIVTDATNVYIKYIRRVTDPNIMPPPFRVALSKLIASRLAVALSQSASRSDSLYKQYIDEDLPTAKSSDSIQDQVDDLPASSWETARYGGGLNRDLRLSTD